MSVRPYATYKIHASVDTHLLQIEEVKAVSQVLDQEEEISIQEFAKFEAKLKKQKRPEAISQ